MKVNCEIAKHVTEHDDPKLDEKKQMPNTSHTFCRKLFLKQSAHSNMPQVTEELDIARDVRNMDSNGGPRIPTPAISSSTPTEQNDAIPNIPRQIELLEEKVKKIQEQLDVPKKGKGGNNKCPIN